MQGSDGVDDNPVNVDKHKFKLQSSNQTCFALPLCRLEKSCQSRQCIALHQCQAPGPGPLAQPQHHVNGVLGALLEVGEGRLEVQENVKQHVKVH